MDKKRVTVDICTKDRYFDTLPMCLMSIAMQTVVPDEIIIYDDSEKPINMWENRTISYIFELFQQKGVKDFMILPGERKGQHWGHQKIQEAAKNEWIWRIDDDEFAETNVLEELLSCAKEGVGAVAGLVMLPKSPIRNCEPNTMANLSDNCQWYEWTGIKECEHLYSSFLYKKGIQDFELNLSPVAHREETIFTYGIFKKGYKLIVNGAAKTWHLRSNTGGIRTGKAENWNDDEITFQNILAEYEGTKICFLDCGMGDHIVFKKNILPLLKEKYKKIILAVCYPELFPNEPEVISIADGLKIANPNRTSPYHYGVMHNFKGNLTEAYKKCYGL